MCFGVRDAIALATREAQSRPLTVLGELVHNETVLADLKSKGVQFRNDTNEVKTETVMITAHGASERRMNAVRGQGLNVLEATCPLVHVAHRAVAQLVKDGFHPVIIGKRDHVEVRGLTEDLPTFDVVLTDDDVMQLAERPRYGIAAQTTQPVDKVRHLVSLIRRQFPNSEVRFVDTVCQPTKQRQNAAVELAQKCDVVIVIGGANSNNTRELVATCSRHRSRVHHVQTASDLRSEWFSSNDIVGITAGTSTPDTLIDAVERTLRTFDSSDFTKPKQGNNMQQWLQYFEHNRAHRTPVAWEKGIQVEKHLLRPLIRSLQKFQLGESGEGRTLRKHAASTRDRTYEAAIDLFIKEEQEHSRLMAEILKRLNAPLLTSDWSDNCFMFMRRLFGLHQELMVLLLPEMIAKRYFRVLHDGTNDPVLRTVFGQIERDEDGHLAFHVAYLRRAFENMSFSRRVATLILWRVVFRVTCAVVMFDHRDVLKAAGTGRAAFWNDCGRVFDEVAAGIFSPANAVRPENLLAAQGRA